MEAKDSESSGIRKCQNQAGRFSGAAPDVTPSRPDSPIPADLYTAEPGEEEPAWVQTEREQFRDFRDLNKDGKLDGSEVGHWVLPPAQDQPLVEANHLLHESDTDKVRGGGPAGGRWGMRRNYRDAGLGLWGSCLQKGRGTETLRWGGRRGGTGTEREGDGDLEAILSFREEPPRWVHCRSPDL